MTNRSVTSLGIDLGTSSVKVLILDPGEGVIGTASAGYELYTSHFGWVEQDPHEWWQSTLCALNGLREKHPAAYGVIRAVSLSGQLNGAVFVDGGSRCLRNVPIWLDHRAEAECAMIDAGLASRLRERTLSTVTPVNTLAKLLWMRDHEPEIYDNAAKVLLPKDWIRLQLTGSLGTDFSDASVTAALDLSERTWAFDLIEELGLRPPLFPDLSESTAVVGEILPEVAAETGLAAGTPVCAGGGDMPCMAVGSGVVTPGIVGLGIGTAAHAIAYTEELDARAVGALWPLCHPHPGGYAWLGCSYTGGASLRWLRDIFSYDSFRELCTEAEGVAPGSEGLFFAPWLEGTATPSPDASARGAYIGLTLRHERGHLIRALMEGVAFDLRQSLECFLAIELSVSTPLRFGEGGSRSALWCQIVADVMGRDLQIIETEDLSAVGAALIAAVGVGQVADFAMGAEIAIVMGDRVEVDPDRCKLYDEAFQRYRDLYPRLQNWFITPVKS